MIWYVMIKLALGWVGVLITSGSTGFRTASLSEMQRVFGDLVV